MGRSLLAVGLLAWLPLVGAAQDTERLYREACEGGDLIACNVFGLMLEHGEGVSQDFTQAADLYERACQGGELVGCTNLGLMFEAGAGVALDSARAVGLYRTACEGGELLGCDRLGAATQTRGPIQPIRFFKSGRVGDAETGEALSGAVVEVVTLGIQSISDASGRVQLSGLTPGTHPLKVERLGYEVLEGQLEVPGNPDFFMLMTPDEVPNLEEPGQIVGRVSQNGDQPLSDVEISVLGQERASTLSNQDGRFTMRGVEPGLVDVRFARIGYAPRSATLVVQPGRTAQIAATMFVEPIELEPIQVTVRSSFLERNGFYERAERPFGTHFTAEQIAEVAPITVTDVIRGRTPGVRLQFLGGVWTALNRRRVNDDCPLTVWLDGIPIPGINLDDLPADDVEAIEVYSGLDTPMQYAGNRCGAILVWTRRS